MAQAMGPSRLCCRAVTIFVVALYDLCCRAVCFPTNTDERCISRARGNNEVLTLSSPNRATNFSRWFMLTTAYRYIWYALFGQGARRILIVCCILNTCSLSSLCSRIQFTVALLWLILPCANALSMKCCLLFLLVTAVSFVSLARRTLFFMSNKNAEEYQHFHQNIFCCQASFVLWITFEYKTVLLEQEGLLMRLHCGHLLRMKCRNCS